MLPARGTACILQAALQVFSKHPMILLARGYRLNKCKTNLESGKVK